MAVVVDAVPDLGITRVSRWIFNGYIIHNAPSAPTAPVAAQATALVSSPRGPRRRSRSAAQRRARPPARRYRSWGWVLALILVIAALAAVAIMGTVWLTQTPRRGCHRRTWFA